MIEVLKVLDDRTAVISTDGLVRVVIQPGNDVRECVPVGEAKKFVEGFNECNRDGMFWAEAKRYTTNLPLSFFAIVTNSLV